MNIKIKYLLLFMSFSISACSSPPLQDRRVETIKPVSVVNPKNSAPKTFLDAGQIEKFRELLKLIYENKEKEAKRLFSRNYRKLPDVIQFAFNLRFENLEYALRNLRKVDFDSESRNFWERVLVVKPEKLSDQICRDITGQTEFPSSDLRASVIEMAWYEEATAYLEGLSYKSKKQKDPWEIARRFSDLPCKMEVDALKYTCSAAPVVLRDKVFADEFLDKVRNGQRRDSAYYAENWKSLSKNWNYQRFTDPQDLYRSSVLLESTSGGKQNHFRRRIKGIARDVRVDSTKARYFGSLIWNEEKDAGLAARLNHVVTSHPLLNLVAPFDHPLAKCQLSVLKQ